LNAAKFEFFMAASLESIFGDFSLANQILKEI
jgi:hypothetical protein